MRSDDVFFLHHSVYTMSLKNINKKTKIIKVNFFSTWPIKKAYILGICILSKHFFFTKVEYANYNLKLICLKLEAFFLKKKSVSEKKEINIRFMIPDSRNRYKMYLCGYVCKYVCIQVRAVTIFSNGQIFEPFLNTFCTLFYRLLPNR